MLPKFNDTPKFTMKVPSTGQEVQFRPYLVKEEKILLMAFESGDNKQALSAVADTILACVDADIKKANLTPYDVEYMFTQIRGKSVGESSTVNIQCEHCQHQNEITIDLDEVYIDKPVVKNTVEINGKYILELKHPSYMEMVKTVSDKDDVSTMFKTIASALHALHNVEDESQVLFADESEKEVNDFLESLPPKVFSEIRQFLEKMPKAKYKVKFKCSNCGEETDKELEGMENFL